MRVFLGTEHLTTTYKTFAPAFSNTGFLKRIKKKRTLQSVGFTEAQSNTVLHCGKDEMWKFFIWYPSVLWQPQYFSQKWDYNCKVQNYNCKVQLKHWKKDTKMLGDAWYLKAVEPGFNSRFISLLEGQKSDLFQAFFFHAHWDSFSDPFFAEVFTYV